MANINPYLNFDGNCEEAFKFYQSIFGGEFTGRSRFKDIPGQPSSDGERILHISLPIGNTILMGSDRNAHMGSGILGNNMHVSIQPSSKEEAEGLFNGLAKGGNITMPLADTFWNATFGMLVDKFGIQWMVNYEYPQG
jgi:PhnB protein